MKITTAPINDAIILAVAKMIDDALIENKRDPSHSELDFMFKQVRLQHVDPKNNGQTVGKYKRLRAVLYWALENSPQSGERLIVLIIDSIRGFGGFRKESKNYVGEEAIKNAISAFSSEGYELSLNGELRPMVLENLPEKELTEALISYVRRAKRGSSDAALLAGTGKDLLEAVAKHVVNIKWGIANHTSNFPTLLGQAFTALNMATPNDKVEPNESPIKRYEKSLYQLGCSVNSIRNKEGTGHGRPFLPTISQEEASNAILAIGTISDYLLMKLK